MEEARIPPLLDVTSGPRQWLRMWGVSAIAWVGLWAVHHASMLGAGAALRERLTWAMRLAHLGDYLISATLVLPFLFLAWKLPLDTGRWRRSVVGLIVLMAAFSAFDVGLCQTIRTQLVRFHEAFRPYPKPLVTIWVLNTVIYGVVATAGWAVQYQREARFRERHASQLEARLSEARLEALRTQLQPHFLFNALNAIAALVRSDAMGAERMIARLSDLLRCSLANGGAQEVTLKEELDITERYVDIERVRFADRLTVERSVTPEALDARVPSLLLQPLVENAIRHGIAFRSGPGRVEITAVRESDTLVLSVRDDGRGFRGESGGRRGQGVGLANTRARLLQLYGTQGSLQIARRPGGGTEVAVRIPWRIASESSAAGRVDALLEAAEGLPKAPGTPPAESSEPSMSSLS
jgi:signal transduction histidine kinase